MIRNTPVNQIQSQALRKAAEQLDNTPGVGNGDGVVSTAEVDKAIAAAKADPSALGDISALQTLKTFLMHCGTEEQGAAKPMSAGGYSPLSMQANNMMGSARAVKDPILLGDGQKIDSCTTNFNVPYGERNVADGQSVVLPLNPGQMHLIELKYQDTRKLRDLEFNYREKGSYNWKTFRGDQYFDMLKKEKSGEIDIKREPDHNGPWVNNPIRVKVDVLYPDGGVHEIGKKFLDFHVHDAHSIDSSGYPETDNISNGYENLPRGALPEGCMLRLTPMHVNRKPWEQDREVAMELSWVKPINLPEYKDKVRINSASSYSKPNAEGYSVDPDRKIAALMVNWTDHGGTSSGSVSLNGENGRWQSPRYNVGSGETELIPVDDYAKDGKVFIHGGGVDVRNIDVLYAD